MGFSCQYCGLIRQAVLLGEKVPGYYAMKPPLDMIRPGSRERRSRTIGREEEGRNEMRMRGNGGGGWGGGGVGVMVVGGEDERKVK